MRTLIKGGHILTASDSYQGDVLIDGEHIALIGLGLNPADADRVVDATGKYIMPGGVDVHTHLDMPLGSTAAADDFFTGQRAAAMGGTTSHIDFAIQTKGERLAQAYQDWRARAEGKAVIDYGFHMTITDPTEQTLGEIGTLSAMGITSIKLLMAYKGRLMVSDETLFRCLLLAREHGLLTLVHAENGDVIDILVKQAIEAGHLNPIWHARTRPPLAEAEATARAVRLAQIAEAPLYVVHMTQRDALDEIRRARRRGSRVYAETCIQYLFWTEDHLDQEGFEGAKWVCSPPFRTSADQAALWDGLRLGDLSVVSTDHCPFNFETQKVAGQDRFDLIPNGVPGIENRLHLLWHAGVLGGRLTPNQFVALVATNPAKIMGMYPRKGTIAVGSDADVVVWDGAAEHTISARTHAMNVDYNLYEGWAIQGRATQVFVRGTLLVDGFQWLGQPGTGMYLHRHKAV